MNYKPHYHGHRKRVRDKIIRSGINSLEDYEVIEFTLMLGRPIVDVKVQAKELIKKCKDFRGVLDAPRETICSVDGVGESSYATLQFIKQSADRYLNQKSNIKAKKVKVEDLITNDQKLLGGLNEEQFKVYYLDSGFCLIDDEIAFRGTVNRSAVYPRKILKSALQKDASKLVFVHNHPNQDIQPTEMDRHITEKLKLSAATLDVDVHDHFIVSSNDFFSFKENEML